jgi:hypothetical protein
VDLNNAPHWWQWPTILSVDAPAVSIVWQTLMARVAGVNLDAAHIVILGVTVWLAYAADRWIEGWRLRARDIRTQRHQFYQRRRWPVAAVWIVVFGANAVLAFTTLEWREIALGACLVLAVLLYLLSHQWVHRHRRFRVPKELCVAALLTCGVCVFLVPPAATGVFVLSAWVFGLLCLTNCALISAWEREVDLAHGQTSIAIDAGAHRWTLAHLPWMTALAALLIAVTSTGPTRLVAVCALVSALMLWMIDRLEPQLGWKAARVWSDVALLTPCVPLWWGL